MSVPTILTVVFLGACCGGDGSGSAVATVGRDLPWQRWVGICCGSDGLGSAVATVD